MFFKKKSYTSIYKKYYKLILKQLNKTEIATNVEFELLPALFTVCDYATLNAKKDRKKVANEIIPMINKKYISNKVQEKEFYERTDLYSEIIRGLPIRGEWILGDTIPEEDRNVITNCFIAMGDILVNPHCADDYKGAALMINGIDEKFKFNMIMFNEVLDSFVQLHNEIYRY
jgi:hypothetical protein